jgi:P63C domain
MNEQLPNAKQTKPDNAMASAGGKASAAKLTPQERKERAQKAAEARWRKEGKLKEMPIVTHGDVNSPLRIGELEIPCFVLSDGKRVLTLRGMLAALDMKKGGGDGGEVGNRLARFVAGKQVNPFIPPGVRDQIESPLQFQLPAISGRGGGGLAYGYEATILADLCEAILTARKAKALRSHQLHIAAQCEVLLGAFARTGIVALVDEATGFQDSRAKDALVKILEEFIAKGLQKWISTFPVDYYKELFRLKNIPYNGSLKRPQYVGHLTNDIVYRRLAPGVLQKLREKNPVAENGQRKSKHFQWLTTDIGYRKLEQHLDSVVSLMKGSDNWDQFMKMIDKAKPIYQETPLFDTLPD